jgi:hypothetical protein
MECCKPANLAEVIGRTGVMLADCVVLASDITTMLTGSKADPPPKIGSDCLMGDAVCNCDIASTILRQLRDIKTYLGG